MTARAYAQPLSSKWHHYACDQSGLCACFSRLPVLSVLLPTLSFAVFRQLNTAIAVSQMSSGQCRLAPLIQVIQDCSHLYHYTVKLMFKLHSCEFPPTPNSACLRP